MATATKTISQRVGHSQQDKPRVGEIKHQNDFEPVNTNSRQTCLYRNTIPNHFWYINLFKDTNEQKKISTLKQQRQWTVWNIKLTGTLHGFWLRFNNLTNSEGIKTKDNKDRKPILLFLNENTTVRTPSTQNKRNFVIDGILTRML